MVSFPLRLVVLGASFGGDGLGLVVDQVVIPGGGHADSLGEYGRVPRMGHSVQRFAPPVIGGNAEPWDGRRGVLHLEDLLFQRHARNKILDTFLKGQRRILVRGGRLLGLSLGKSGRHQSVCKNG